MVSKGDEKAIDKIVARVDDKERSTVSVGVVEDNSTQGINAITATQKKGDVLSMLQICPLYIFGNKTTDGTYRSIYSFPGCGFDSGPYLQPCLSLFVY